jgi:hypothetical protein
LKTYIGQWKKSKQHGFGMMIDHKDESSWSGMFNQSKKQGAGIYKVGESYSARIFDQEKLKKEVNIS